MMEEMAHILVADDDSISLKIFVQLLTHTGYQVDQAESVEEVMQKVRQLKPDLVLMHVGIDADSGIEACHKIKTDPQLADVFVVLISGLHTETEEQAAGLESGADGYIARPISNRELLARLEALLRIKATEKRLRESEERLQLVMQVTNDGIFDWHIPTNDVTFNPAYFEMLGYEADELPHTLEIYQSLLHPDDLKRSEENLNRYLKGEDAKTGIEIRFKTKSGDYKWLLSRGKIVEFDEDDNPVRFVGSNVDISERKQVEEALLEKQNQLLEAQHIAHIGNWWHDLVTGEIFWSDEFFRIIGREPQKPTAELAPVIIHPDDLHILQHAMDEAAAGKVEHDHEFRIIRPDGSIRWIHNRWVGIYDEAGKEIKRVGTHQDITERKLAEQALQQNEALLRIVAENYPNSYISIIEKDLTIGFTSGQEFKKQNLDPAQYVGLTLEQVFGEHTDFVRDQYLKTFRGEEVTFELEINNQDQFYKTVPLAEPDGSIQRVLVVVENITERKQAEDALRESEYKYRTLMEQASDGIAIADPQGRLIDVNQSTCKILGYSTQDLLELSIQDLLPKEEQETQPIRFDELRTGKTIISERPFLRKDGSTLPVEASVKMLEDGCFLGILRDISERKQTEEKMLRADQRLRLHSEQSPLGFLEWDENFCAIDWNAACERIFGYTREEAIGRHAKDLILHPEVHELVDGIYHNLMNQAGGQHSINENITKDGRIITCEWFNTTLIDKDGKAIGVASVCSDITERVQAEQERQAHLRFLESMDQINRAIQGSNDLEQMMSDVLDAVLSVFDCDRVSLVYPCDPDSLSWSAPMERTKPEWPGVFTLGLEVPMDPEVARVFKISRDAGEPVGFGPGYKESLPTEIAAQFNIQSQITMALYPKMGKPWNFVIHQCSRPRVWTQEERRFLGEIGRRLEDALTSLLVLRNLRESEERYRSLFESSPDAVFLLDVNGCILDCNRIAEERYGYSRQELLQMTVRGLTMPNLHEEKERRIKEILENGGQFEWRHQRKDKSELPVEISAVGISLGGQRCILSNVRDISEREQAMKELQKTHNLLRTIIETAPTAIIGLDLDGKVQTIWNPAAEKLLGWSAEEAMGKFLPSVPVEKEEEFHQFREQIRSGKILNGVDVQRRKRDGTPIDYSIYASPLYSPEGQIIGNIAVLVDITERKRGEKTLQLQLEFLNTLIDTIPNPIFYKDKEGRYTGCNVAFENFLGRPKEEIIGKTVYDMGPKEIADQYYAQDQELFQNLGKQVYEWKVKKKTGEIREVIFNKAAFKDPDGQVRGLVGVIIDITERKQAEENLQKYSEKLEEMVEARTQELREAQEKLLRQEHLAALGQLAGGVGHELRNPLSVIQNAIYYLNKIMPQADEKVKEYLGIIAAETKNAEKIITDLLEFSRTKSIDRQPVNIERLVKDTLERYPLPNEIAVSLEVPPDLPLVHVDPHHLEQVLGNLFTNAYQAMSSLVPPPSTGRTEGGILTVTAKGENTHVRLTISDTGVGIPAENLEKIFEPLFTTKAKGIGLGLAVSQKLIEANESRIEVQSEIGKGSTFTLHLPIFKEQDSEA